MIMIMHEECERNKKLGVQADKKKNSVKAGFFFYTRIHKMIKTKRDKK